MTPDIGFFNALRSIFSTILRISSGVEQYAMAFEDTGKMVHNLTDDALRTQKANADKAFAELTAK